MRTFIGPESLLTWIMNISEGQNLSDPDLSMYDDIREDDVVLGKLSSSARQLLAIEQAVDSIYACRCAEIIENDSLKQAQEFNTDRDFVGELVLDSIRGLLCAQVNADLLAANVDSELFADDFALRSDGSIVVYRADN